MHLILYQIFRIILSLSSGGIKHCLIVTKDIPQPGSTEKGIKIKKHFEDFR